MGGILILNGSPRAARSNSKRYAAMLEERCGCETAYFPISKTNHQALCGKLGEVSDVVLVFPLYADGIPVTLLNFLKALERHPPKHRPTVSVLINCGFLECRQNDAAVEMVRLFCRQNGYRFGSVLKIGSGEAIWDTPFRLLVARKIRRLAASLMRGAYGTWQVTMPLSPRLFLRASTAYWTKYGERNGVTRAQMETMEIEGQAGGGR